LKLKDTKKETSVKVSEGDMISWDEARLVSTRSTPIRTAVLAIDAFTINPNN
jgi:hypothetical protein